MPNITDSVTIQGPTGIGTGGQTVPQVQITENATSTAGTAFVVQAASTQIRNLIIDGIQGDAIDLNGGQGIVAGCYIGVDPTGTALIRNTGDGILINSPLNTIGDTSTNPNVITGNNFAIQVLGGQQYRQHYHQ